MACVAHILFLWDSIASMPSVCQMIDGQDIEQEHQKVALQVRGGVEPRWRAGSPEPCRAGGQG